MSSFISLSCFVSVSNLSQPGTFAGNDAIVAFARSQQVKVVIHQLNMPLWEVSAERDFPTLHPYAEVLFCTTSLCSVLIADKWFRETGVQTAAHRLPLRGSL